MIQARLPLWRRTRAGGDADLFVVPVRGGFGIEINSATLPRGLVNRRYYSELSRTGQDKASKAWLSDCLASAHWLVKALDQRRARS